MGEADRMQPIGGWTNTSKDNPRAAQIMGVNPVWPE